MPPPEAGGPLLTPRMLGIILSGLFFFLSAGTVIPVLPHFIEDELGGGSLAVGVVVGAFSFSAVLTRPTAGRMGNRVGRRRLMIVGGLVAGASLAAYGLAPSVAVLVLLRLVTGVGEGLFFTGSATLVADLAPPARRGEALSYYSVAVYLGLGLGPSLGQGVSDSAGSAWAFAVAGGAAAVAALVAVLLPDLRPTLTEPEARQPLVHRKALGPGAVLALGLMGFTAFQAFVPLYADTIGLATSQYVFLLYAAVVLCVRVFGARIPDHFGAPRTGTAATLGIAAGLTIMAAVATAGGLYLGAAVLGLGMALQYPALMAMAVNRAEDHERAAVVGTFTAFFDLAQGAGGLILGGVAALGGYRASFAGGAVCALGALALLRLRVAPTRTITAVPAEKLLAEPEAWVPPGAE